MDERILLDLRERPLETDGDGSSLASGRDGRSGGPLADPRALTILTTEHWSLLSARGLVYNEAFARAGMFLTFLSTTLVGLGLFSATAGFSSTFLVVVAVVLGVDLFIGLSTLGRVASATSEDLRMLQGMNRLRHAYHEMLPGLEDYFVWGKHDDMRGVFAIYNAPAMSGLLRPMLHAFTTVPGSISVICAALAGIEAGVLSALLGVPGYASIAVGVGVSLVVVWLSIAMMQSTIRRFAERSDVKFPTPAERSPE